MPDNLINNHHFQLVLSIAMAALLLANVMQASVSQDMEYHQLKRVKVFNCFYHID